MLKRIILSGLTLLPLLAQPTFASDDALKPPPGPLFKVTSSGNTLTINTTKRAWFYPFAGIKILSEKFGLGGNAFPSDNGYYHFPVSDTEPAVITVSGPVGNSGKASRISTSLCLNGVGKTYNCETHTVPVVIGPRFAYVTDLTSGNVSVCAISASTGALSECTSTSGFNFHLPETIALNPAGTFAYIADNGNGLAFCAVDAVTGELNKCAYTGDLTNIQTAGVVLNAAGNRAYVSYYNGGTASIVQLCTVEASGELTGCAPTGSGFSGTTDLEGITLNPSGTFAYVANNSGGIFYCPIDKTTGELGVCHLTGTLGLSAAGITLNAAGTVAYETERGGAISVCTASPSTGLLTGCVPTATGVTLAVWGNVAINTAGTYAYAPNHNHVSLCSSVDPTTGALSGCSDTGGNSFNEPSGIALLY